MTSRIHVLDSGSASPDLRFDAGRLRGIAGSAPLTITHDPACLAAEIGPADILLTNAKVDIGALRKRAPHLRWVQVISAGVEAYLPTLPPDVMLTNASGVHSEKGAEFVLAAVLMLNYRIPSFLAAQARHDWAQDFVRPLRGKCAVILGAGAIGGAAIRLLHERGMRVIAVTRSGTCAVPVEAAVTLERLRKVLPDADFLINTLPATTETTGVVGAVELALLADGAGIVNVSRAAVFDKDALGAALPRLSGLVSDVFHAEPMPKDDPAWDWPGLIATPHCSVDDHEGYIDRCMEIFAENLRRFRAGETLVNLVDPTKGY
ncbi:D-2-hydroxyacid dehydrogenase [Falsirhodobacter halotolerans]|uniref:D-2-hydroxyacid dehydrogenase n=1 Tax=Falsirhodobacter halotolerans TaxID=1146892 RepID=UPI001FD31D8D|nr:D-2-hydroxyacid dehydrogenase [Falsirhodobacter halotolerans]MCJ8139101.1 D-2-hydroxyacid dehydrogenase [Falsirhodobacter halotolerans]